MNEHIEAIEDNLKKITGDMDEIKNSGKAYQDEGDILFEAYNEKFQQLATIRRALIKLTRAYWR